MSDACWVMVGIALLVPLFKGMQIWWHHRQPATKGRNATYRDEPWDDPAD
ncbi:MAG TPA: hypothetical protein VD997_02765 [Phycisphaerales bacterium]|nr:hypothetical protein [Phycisphaerales bacterium]